jgi:hypothetical protein
MFKVIALLFAICAHVALAADFGAPYAVAIAGTLPPAGNQVLGYVTHADCHPIADEPAVYINTEGGLIDGKFYVSTPQCDLLARIKACNGLRYQIVAAFTVQNDWAGFPQKMIFNILSLGDATTNPVCLPAPAYAPQVPPRHNRH